MKFNYPVRWGVGLLVIALVALFGTMGWLSSVWFQVLLITIGMTLSPFVLAYLMVFIYCNWNAKTLSELKSHWREF